tara:strand:- start:1815 stop:2747 length:933 start_codon:yes stop_codon:yes gene_type:complete
MSRRLRKIKKRAVIETPPKLLKYYPSESFKIGFIIPVTSNRRNYQDVSQTDFFKILFPSFLKTVSSDSKYQYSFYLGYDDDDDFYLKSLEETDRYFNEVCQGKYTLQMHPMKELKGKVGQIWTNLALIAAKECDYLYQSGDDIKFLCSGWEDIFITKLRKNDNFGVVGPWDTKYNDGRILTQSFVHVTHLQIFGFYYPSTIVNWYVDDWITSIYNASPEREIEVQNCGGTPRYQVKNNRGIYLQAMMEFKPKLYQFLEDLKLEKVRVFKTEQELYFVEDGILYIGSSRVTEYEKEIQENTYDDIKREMLS